jgi:lysophospholipase L1-like esterase
VAAGVGLVSILARQGEGAPSLPSPNGSPGPLVPQFTPIRAGDRLLLVGDSLAQGLAAPLKRLAADGSVNATSDGRVGTRIDQWAQQTWLQTDLQSSPTFVLVSLGTNDMKLANALSERPLLDQLLARLRASNARVVWILPPTMPFPDPGVRAMIADTGVLLFRSDLLAIARGPDSIHPTAAGYAGWAGSIWQFLLRGGALTPRRRG